MRMAHKTKNVQVPTWLGAPHVTAMIKMPEAKMASSCHMIAANACEKRGQPLDAVQGSLRGPVSQPVKKVSSCHPQISKAQVNAQYALTTLDCFALCMRPKNAASASTDEINRLQRKVVRGIPFSSSTKPVENHQMKMANTTGIDISIMGRVA